MLEALDFGGSDLQGCIIFSHTQLPGGKSRHCNFDDSFEGQMQQKGLFAA